MREDCCWVVQGHLDSVGLGSGVKPQTLATQFLNAGLTQII